MKRLRGSGRNEPRVTIGVHESEGSAAHGEDGATLIDIAGYHEFGTSTIPARPFISGWADEKRADIEGDLHKMGVAIIRGKVPSVRIALERLGVKFVGDVQVRIKSNIAPPLAQSTIDAKGSSTPLIDTGQLWTSVTHKVK